MGHQHWPADIQEAREFVVSTWLTESLRIMEVTHGINTPVYSQKKAELEAEAEEFRKPGVFLGESMVSGAPSLVAAGALAARTNIDLINLLIFDEGNVTRQVEKIDVGAGVKSKILFTMDAGGQSEGKTTVPDHFIFIKEPAVRDSSGPLMTEVSSIIIVPTGPYLSVAS